MKHPDKWKIVLAVPGESEVSLLANLSQRDDVDLLGVVDQSGEAVGTAIAELMRLPIYADLSAPEIQNIDYFVYPAGEDGVEPLLEEAERRGMAPLPSSQFARMCMPQIARRMVAPPGDGFETLERETESIHRTLSRIEEALQRESLLRWLLSLATRAIGATGGSIMLYDEKTEELYIAYAYGLSEATLHRTRIRLDEGIAGRVARSLRSELLSGAVDGSQRADRPQLTGAISAPLIWEDRLLGVLNVSVVDGDPALTEDDLATIDRLARRLGLILSRFLGIQRAQVGDMFRHMDRQLQDLMNRSDEISTILPAWVGTMAIELGAARVSLALVCEDGTLLVAEGTQEGGTSLQHEILSDPGWREVLESGGPLVVRQADPEPSQDGGLTLFYLPIGSHRMRAVLSVVYDTAVKAHRFHDISGEVVYLLEKRLIELVSRIGMQDRLERLMRLTTALTQIVAESREGGTSFRDRIVETARELTGAAHCHLVSGISESGIDLVDEDLGDKPWLADAERLLQEAQSDGWRVTLISDSVDPQLKETCLLAATSSDEAPAPGLLLRDKSRLHELDGAAFTDFDGQLAQRLASLLPHCFAEEVRPAILVSVGTEQDVDHETADVEQQTDRLQHDIVLEMLRREMDRCDRYHTAFALIALRPENAETWGGPQARDAIKPIREQVRSSDIVTCLGDGTILLIAPEDVQAVSRLQKRLVGMLQQLSGKDEFAVQANHAIYPGRLDDPAKILNEVLGSFAAGA